MTTLAVDRLLDADVLAKTLRADARAGLTARPKALPPKWFYDARGSELFEDITRLPEYYPTRTERGILAEHAADIAAATGADTLVELGSGSSEKTRLLLDALADAGTLTRYVPFDVSEPALVAASEAVLADYPGMRVHAVVGDFEQHLGLLPDGGRRLTAFLGSTIGNLEPGPRAAFLADVRSGLGEGDALLLGTDLVKSPDVLVPAYDDASGVTAAFNLNVLHVLNRELDADFDVDRFRHLAVWDAEAERIEMRLQAQGDQPVRVEALDLDVTFTDGEQMRTEVSSKFRREGVEAELAAAGFALASWWTDPAGSFGLSLAVPV
ncbi:MAG: L-histidine N(alpha)-methyltransferase [Actinomycetes bacterium]